MTLALLITYLIIGFVVGPLFYYQQVRSCTHSVEFLTHNNGDYFSGMLVMGALFWPMVLVYLTVFTVFKIFNKIERKVYMKALKDRGVLTQGMIDNFKVK